MATSKSFKRVLLDHCVPRTLIREMSDYPATHVSTLGWQQYDDRPLLERADKLFDVFVTVDRNIPAQQQLTRYSIAVIILRAHKNSVPALLPLVPDLLATFERIKPGELYELTI